MARVLAEVKDIYKGKKEDLAVQWRVDVRGKESEIYGLIKAKVVATTEAHDGMVRAQRRTVQDVVRMLDESI